ncbi:hypothetical protein McanMca71_001702 [Microsporum canis]|uniref:Fibronectin n=1 Tax=Arthroderma otae (strain ATCC MYA-4605 / CBS 113480) TaxID=554155 RepID=C5FXS0_ARTOC|nr:fibronectin [Microsporum canis CBS 113480]EEQ35110.1 fibronectin [Microsporum canis CBS 113480]
MERATANILLLFVFLYALVSSSSAAPPPWPGTSQYQDRTNGIAASIDHGLVARQPGLRVMFVGDSMTQGKHGDCTWRYRMWQWFQNQGVAVTFVGPYTGTVEPDQPAPPYGSSATPVAPIKTSGGYALDVSPDFDRHHFAVWGRAAAISKDLIHDVLSAHPADMMLLMLGFNDLGWLFSQPIDALGSLYALINNARKANPNLKFAIANVPQRSFIGREDLPVTTQQYNSLLRDALPQWSTEQSPIHLVELQENYSCGMAACEAGYDGLHPNAQGEYQIAHAFTLTLVNDFKIGSSPLMVPLNSRGGF